MEANRDRIRELTEKIGQMTRDAAEASPELAALYTRAADIAWMARAAFVRGNEIEGEMLVSDLVAAESALPAFVA